MGYGNTSRRGFLKQLAVVVGVLALFSATTPPAQAHGPHVHGHHMGGYGYYRGTHSRLLGGFPGSGLGYGGYGGLGYGGLGYGGLGGYGGGFYNRGYYGGGFPYGGYGGFGAPVAPVVPYYNYGVPILNRDDPKDVFDPRTLLEC